MTKTLALFMVMALTLFAGCDDTDTNLLTIAPEGEYLPTTQTNRSFLRESFSHPDLSNKFGVDTVRLNHSGEMVVDNVTYQTLNLRYVIDISPDGAVEYDDIFHTYRREGSRYLEPRLNPDDEEHVFLDIAKPVGSSWSYLGGFNNDTRTIYRIKSISARRQINGKLFENVVEVETEIQHQSPDGTWYRLMLSNRYFAKDVGEVYRLFRWYGYTFAIKMSAL